MSEDSGAGSSQGGAEQAESQQSKQAGPPQPGPEAANQAQGKAEERAAGKQLKAHCKIQMPQPVFVRFLAGFGAAVLVGGALLGNMILSTVHGFFAHAEEPQFIKDTLQAMSYKDGLPGDFQVQAAFKSEPVLYLVYAESLSELSHVAVYSFEPQGEIDGKTQIDYFYGLPLLAFSKSKRADVPAEDFTASFKSVKEQGRKEIEGGRTVHYLVGTLRDHKGIVYDGAIACLVKKKKVLLVQYMQPADRPFSLQHVFDILRGASSF